MDTVKCQRARKVLVEYFLDKGIACWVELIQELFNQVKGQQVDAAVSLQIVLQQEMLVFVFNKILGIILP